MRFCLQRCDVWFDGFAGHVAMVPFGPRPPTGGPPISQEGSSPLRKEGKQSTQRRWGRGRRRPERGTQMPAMTTSNWGAPPRRPAVTTSGSSRRPCSQARCSLVAGRRGRPSAWSTGSVRTPPGGSAAVAADRPGPGSESPGACVPPGPRRQRRSRPTPGRARTPVHFARAAAQDGTLRRVPEVRGIGAHRSDTPPGPGSRCPPSPAEHCPGAFRAGTEGTGSSHKER